MKYYLKKYQSKVGNVNISLKKSISIQTLLNDIKNPDSKQRSKPLEKFNSLFFWDLGKQASERIEPGDIIYIVTKNEVYWGCIDVHIIDPSGGIGDAISWARQFHAPWENPIGMSVLKKVTINSEIESQIDDSINSGSKIINSFFQIKGDINFHDNSNKKSIQNIDASSISRPLKDNAIHGKTMKQSDEEIVPREINGTNENFILNNKIIDLQSRLKILKSSFHHSEREHESLVERFFEYLGFQSPNDIKYRIGFIDVLINPNSKNSFVVEVKRDWALSRNNKNVIDQAFKYAHHQGSRFVVITNGDYYAFHDRYRGLSISEAFDFELHLSEVNNNDIQLLKKYNKVNL